MAGEWLIKQINSRGGNASDYANILYGNVISDKPLKVQLSDKITLTAPFLIVGQNVTDYKQKIIIDGQTKDITVKNALKSGDKVAMFRLDGGQQFYIFEKLSDEALKEE